MFKERYLKKLAKFKTKNDITIRYYDGYNSIHIDIEYQNETVAWLIIDDNNNIKICKIKEFFGQNSNDKYIIKTIIKISRFLNISEINGRVNYDSELCKKLFLDNDFSFKELYDKKEKTAKVSYKNN